MAAAARWKVKDGEKKEYERGKLRTDYNIPMFGFKSAILIFVVGILTLAFIPELLLLFMKDVRIVAALLCGVINGFVVTYTQFFVERKKGFTKGFWIVFALVSAFLTAFLVLLYTTGFII